MKCKYCQSEIDARAKVCPHCRRKQSNDGLIITLSVIGVLLFLSIGIPVIKGFSEASKNATVSVGAPTTQEKTEALTEAPTEESTGTDNATDATAVVLYDKDGIKISYLGLERNERKAAVNLLIENDTDVSRLIQARDFSINGFMVTEAFSSDVAANKKCYDSIDVRNSQLEKSKITDIKDIEFKFCIMNADDWNVKTESEPFKITVD